jgi:hypothetical protein
MGTSRLIRIGVFVVAAGLLGWGALANAVIGVAARHNPSVALQFDSNDAVSLATLASQKLTENPASIDVAAVDKAARQSLGAQALNPVALTLLGYVADMRRDQNRAAALINTSATMTRRNLLSQLWLIEERVRANDISGALTHYDIALKVSDEAGPRLLPVLGSAMQEPDIRRQLVAYIRAPWMPSLLSYTTSNLDPRSVWAFLKTAGGLPRGYADPQLPNLLITTLVGRGFLQEARDYYFFDPKADTTVARDAAFTNLSTDPSGLLSWHDANQSGIDSDFETASAGGLQLSVIVDSGAGGIVMQKLTMLDPGRYRIVPATSDLPDTGQLSLDISCARKSDAPYLQVPVSTLRDGAKSSFVVPGGCPVQVVSLLAARRTTIADRPFKIGSMHIQAINGG